MALHVWEAFCDLMHDALMLPFCSQSDVIDNRYGTTYSIKLLLDRRWRGDESDRTRHCSRKTIRTPFAAHTPVLINSESSPSSYRWNKFEAVVGVA